MAMSKSSLLCHLFVFSAIGIFATQSTELEEVYRFNTLDFQWDNNFSSKEFAVEKGLYVPENNVPLGMELWKNKIFLTIPRLKKGVPATLAYIDRSKNSSALIPYPDWATNEIYFFNHISARNQFISIIRVRIDACNRLWALDEGVLERLDNKTMFRNPTLFVFDLNTDRFLRFYQFTDEDTPTETFVVDLEIDVTSHNCDNAFAYVTDPMTSKILVYSWAQHSSWTVDHPFLSYDPLQTNFYVNGVNYQWKDGVFGITMSEPNADGFRTIFFQPISGANTFSVSSQVLQNKQLLSHPDNYYFFTNEGRKGNHTQGSSLFLDHKTNVLFQTQVNKYGLACWNIFKPLNEDTFNLFVENYDVLIYPNDLKFDSKKRELYVLANKFPNFLYGKLNTTEVNFRILKINVDKAIQNTPCQPKK